MASETNTATMEAGITCPICLTEDSNPYQMVGLTSCPCQCIACQDCLQTWFDTCAARGQDTPTCPKCRHSIDLKEASVVLGRQYTRSTLHPDSVLTTTTTTTTSSPPSPPVDDLTNDWLHANGARQCQNCGVWIVREDGCDAMMCLCGHRFCFQCGATPDQCECGNSLDLGDFFDNVHRMHVNEIEWENFQGDYEEVIQVATAEQMVDMRGFLEAHRDRGGEHHRETEEENDDSEEDGLFRTFLEERIRERAASHSDVVPTGEEGSGGEEGDFLAHLEEHIQQRTANHLLLLGRVRQQLVDQRTMASTNERGNRMRALLLEQIRQCVASRGATSSSAEADDTDDVPLLLTPPDDFRAFLEEHIRQRVANENRAPLTSASGEGAGSCRVFLSHCGAPARSHGGSDLDSWQRRRRRARSMG